MIIIVILSPISRHHHHSWWSCPTTPCCTRAPEKPRASISRATWWFLTRVTTSLTPSPTSTLSPSPPLRWLWCVVEVWGSWGEGGRGRRWGDIVSGQWCVVVDHIVSWWLVGVLSWFVMVGEETFKLIWHNEYIYIHIYKIHFHERIVLPRQTSRHILQHYFIITTPSLQFHSYLMAIFHNSSTFLSPPFQLSSTIFLCPFTFFNTPTFLQQPIPPSTLPVRKHPQLPSCLPATLQLSTVRQKHHVPQATFLPLQRLPQAPHWFDVCLFKLFFCLYVCSCVCMFAFVFFLFYTFPWLSYVHFAIFQSVKFFFFIVV